MEAKDLRIGNLVNSSKYGEIEVEWISYDIEFDPAQYNPIPLTEEWLLRFGFEGDLDYGWVLRRVHIAKANEFYFTGWDDDDVEIEYVHQLQNLYHALTGEELSINE